jgi:hypothetical protein
VATEAGTGQRYATQVGRLWSGLARTLTTLEAFAGEPERLEDDEALGELRGLQYRLHLACERAFGLAPPAGTEEFHGELASALEGARDATGEIAETLELDGPETAALLVHEWRGALFRVRLARLRLSGPRLPTDPTEPLEPTHRHAALIGLLLAVLGAAAFAYGATSGDWPIWTVGMVAVCASFIAYRP